MIRFEIIDKTFLNGHLAQFTQLIAGWQYSTWNAENFLYDLPKKWEFSFSAWEENKLIAFCFASNKIKDAYYIHLIYISAESRGQSLGAKMIEHAKEIAREHNINHIELRCPESNTGSLEFYKKQKFTTVEKLSDATSGNEADYYLRLDF